MLGRFVSALLLAASLAQAVDVDVVDQDVAGSEHHFASKWYHDESHSIHSLFRRASNDEITYSPVGSPDWARGFPTDPVSMLNMPQTWLDALHAAIAAGKIPDIPVTTMDGPGPTYPDGYDPMSPDVCSSTAQCRIPGDIWDGPPGALSLSFDDGPLPPSPTLYRFLKEKEQHVTHFFIGSNILQYHDYFQTAWLDNEDDIAVHTWTHPYMTTKTNGEVLAELGWTMQIIHNSTGGRVPKYWRPPYGDSDARVRAIAKEVFGLTTVIWNRDTIDWSLADPTPLTSLDQIAAQMQTWLTGPKDPGLIILEHELSELSVQAFMHAWDLMVSNGWHLTSVAQMGGVNAYQNSWNATSPVAPARIGEVSVHPLPPLSPATSSSTGTAQSTGKPNPPTTNHKNSAAPHFAASTAWFWLLIFVAIFYFLCDI